MLTSRLKEGKVRKGGNPPTGIVFLRGDRYSCVIYLIRKRRLLVPLAEVTVGDIIISDWKGGNALTIYFQWRKAGGESFRVAVMEKKSSFLLFLFLQTFFARANIGKHEGVAGNRT